MRMVELHTRERAARAPAGVTRRGLLMWGAAATALAVSAAQNTDAVSAQGFDGRPEDALPMQRTSAVGRLKEESSARRAVRDAQIRRPVKHRERLHAAQRAISAPVFSLGDYVRRTPGARAFPHNAVLLTIDDGPHPEWTPKILRLLRKYDAPATFYVIGRQAKRYPELVRAAVTEGHHVANHSYSHPLKLPWLPAAAMTAELLDSQDAIVRASGFTPRQFRAPGGLWSPRMMRLAVAHDLMPIDWNVDPRDWSRPGSGHIVDTMLAAGPGDVLLCHDGGGDRSETYEALEIVLPQLKARGLQFVTLPAPQPHHRWEPERAR